jgi:hypothetical protein
VWGRAVAKGTSLEAHTASPANPARPERQQVWDCVSFQHTRSLPHTTLVFEGLLHICQCDVAVAHASHHAQIGTHQLCQYVATLLLSGAFVLQQTHKGPLLKSHSVANDGRGFVKWVKRKPGLVVRPALAHVDPLP